MAPPPRVSSGRQTASPLQVPQHLAVGNGLIRRLDQLDALTETHTCGRWRSTARPGRSSGPARRAAPADRNPSPLQEQHGGPGRAAGATPDSWALSNSPTAAAVASTRFHHADLQAQPHALGCVDIRSRARPKRSCSAVARLSRLAASRTETASVGCRAAPPSDFPGTRSGSSTSNAIRPRRTAGESRDASSRRSDARHGTAAVPPARRSCGSRCAGNSQQDAPAHDLGIGQRQHRPPGAPRPGWRSAPIASARSSDGHCRTPSEPQGPERSPGPRRRSRPGRPASSTQRCGIGGTLQQLQPAAEQIGVGTEQCGRTPRHRTVAATPSRGIGRSPPQGSNPVLRQRVVGTATPCADTPSHPPCGGPAHQGLKRLAPNLTRLAF
jgi:hypothetical protein